MAEDDLISFINSLLINEPQLLQVASNTNDCDLYQTPSLSVPSTSGFFFPTLSEESIMTNMQGVFLRIVEQPVPKFRFRYRSEMQGAHGSLLGRGETTRKKSFPAVELVNYDGDDAVIRCLLYTASDPPVPHMHQLIGKENNREILDHEVVVSERNGYRAEFKGLGIVHMSKKDLKKELLRKKEISLFEQLRRDDQLANFDDETLRKAVKTKSGELEAKAFKEAENIDPNKVKLCFQAFLRGDRGEVHYLCDSVFSDTIQNMKSAETGDLKICRIDKVAGTCMGGDEIYILVEKVCKKNIHVRFYELDEHDREVWSDFGQFGELDVHHQYAIVFRTPPYRRTDIQGNVNVKVQLVRPKDKAVSDAVAFSYKPARRYISGKRVCQNLSSSDSCSSLEAPNKRSLQVGDDDPMLSGQSFSSLSFPSDTIQEVLRDIASKDEESILTEFEGFVNSSFFEDYSKSFEAEQGIGAAGQIESHIPNLPSPLEVFGQVEVDHEMAWSPDSALGVIQFQTSGECGDIVLRDGIGKKKTASKKEPNILEPIKHSKDDSSTMAKRAYSKLLKLMKSRHPSRLQDMKSIIRAEDQDFGPLHAAVLHRQLKELSDLLSLIIKSNLLKLINSPNRRNQTPLMVAVEENNLDCLKLLSMARADLNCVDHRDNSAFHLAARNKHSKCLEILLSSGPLKDALGKVELDRKNDKGETALHIAVRQKDHMSVELLVKAGANLNAKTGTAGQTPLHLAVESKCIEIVEYLLGRESINLGELNFRKQRAEDLIQSDQKEMFSLFRKFHGIEAEEREKDDAGDSVQGHEEQEDDEDEESNNSDEDDGEGKVVGEEVEENCEGDKNLSCTTQKDSAIVMKEGSNKSESIFQSTEADDFSLLDQITIDEIAHHLDSGKKWESVCQELRVEFLIQTFATISSPTRCLITYLECEKKKKLSEFRDALVKLNILGAVKALDNSLNKNGASTFDE